MNIVRRLSWMLTSPLGVDGDGDPYSDLRDADVPITTADCRACSNPCDEGHDEYPKRFSVDMDSEMRGSVKPYRRQILISTGKSDWEREVTHAKGTLAAYLSDVNDAQKKLRPRANSKVTSPNDVPKPAVGVFDSSESSRLSILNGSHRTCSHDPSLQTVIVLPDYKAVCEVEASHDSAEAVWQSALDPTLGRAGATGTIKQFKTWMLPYDCVILLCSHKKRDNRCHIAAPKLENAFSHSLTAEGWRVDTQLEDLECAGPPLEELEGTDEERDEEILRRLKSIGTEKKKALVLKNSHIGGHRYAGNVIIYTPQGSSVWYGRVSPHEVDSIVKNTILDGQILPEILRGGMNLSRPGCSRLTDW